jgi:hypothetical protein
MLIAVWERVLDRCMTAVPHFGSDPDSKHYPSNHVQKILTDRILAQSRFQSALVSLSQEAMAVNVSARRGRGANVKFRPTGDARRQPEVGGDRHERYARRRNPMASKPAPFDLTKPYSYAWLWASGGKHV